MNWKEELIAEYKGAISPERRFRSALLTSGGVLLGLYSVWMFQRVGAFLLPTALYSAGLAVLMVVSTCVRRPFLAVLSSLSRGWPLQWFWHPQVRPAYTVTTLLCGVFFASRALIQWAFVNSESILQVGIVRLLTGWPSTIILFSLVYIVGRIHLQRLQGPSVEEFQQHQSPPWKGQEYGF